MRKLLLGLLSAILGISLIGIPQGNIEAQAASPVTLKVSPAKPVRTAPFTVSGTLRTAVTRPVELQALVAGKWKKITSGKTGKTGKYSLKAATTKPSLRLRVVAARTKIGNTTYRRLVSKATTVKTRAAAISKPKVSPTKPIKGERFTVKGTILPKVSRPVTLQGWIGGKWKKLASGKTTKSGKYSLTTSTTKASLRVRVIAAKKKVGKHTHARIASKPVTVKLAKQSAKVAMPKSVHKGEHTTATAIVSPVRKGRPVKLQVRVDGTWTTAGKASLNAKGVAKIGVRPTRTGSLSYRVVVPAWRGAPAVASSTVKVGATKNSQVSGVDRPPAGSGPNDAGGTCNKPAPPAGTRFGASVATTSTVWLGDALAERDAYFGELAAARIWHPGMTNDWTARKLKVVDGRTMVISFRPHPTEVLSGKHDAALREWFEQAPARSTIYWSYYHEPEPAIEKLGSFTADTYRRAWKHINKIADSVCRPNMYSTLILTGWTTRPESKRDWRKYYPGAEVIDVLAFDPYNGVHEPGRDYYEKPAAMLGNIVRVAKEARKPWGIAEIGSRKIASDPTGSKRAAWLTSVADYTRANGALFVTYYHSSRDGEWRLLDKPSQDAWIAAVARSPR